MRVAIVSTGDELLRGTNVDTNAPWLAARLDALGHRVIGVRVVGDDAAALGQAFAEAFASAELTLVSGGLGPTTDDLTAQVVADLLGRPLESRPEAVAQIEAAFARLGYSMPANNLKQALLPAGARLLSNPVGTAPGFVVATPSRGEAWFLPGPPRELQAMAALHLWPELPDVSASRHRLQLRLYGLGESRLQEIVAPLSQREPSLRFGFRASFPALGLTVGADDAATLARAEAELRPLLAQYVFATGEVELPEAVVRDLTRHGLTLATAESCTGGLVAHLVTAVPGASATFRGAIVAYANDAKRALLGVDEALLATHGAVSEEVVRAMAAGARERFHSDLAVATSGVAGPGGGSPEKPVGTVHLALAHPGGTLHRLAHFPAYERGRIQVAAAHLALDLVRRHLLERP